MSDEEIKSSFEEKKKTNFSKQGRLNRAAGRRFETKVRLEMERLGWVVSRWMNTIEQEKEGGIWKISSAKQKFIYNPKIKKMIPLGISSGFPDFVCFRRIKGEETIEGTHLPKEYQNENGRFFEVIGLEVKSDGYLDKIEKEMCYWLIENKIFSRILIAKALKEGKRIKIEYIDFIDKYNKK